MRLLHFLRVLGGLCLPVGAAFAAVEPSAPSRSGSAEHIPATAPRTGVLAGRADAFRAYCLGGAGAKAFAKIKADLDRNYLNLPFPAEPLTYGNPDPAKRTSDLADKWHAAQDACGLITGVAEAATLCWIVTGEPKYLAKAKDFLLKSCQWRFGPDWTTGPAPGATDIAYNDEAHFRLWRKFPLVYDQIRAELSAAEQKVVLNHFRERGNRSVRWIEETGGISKVVRNSIASDLSSHPVRFMPMTGLAALALWDDLPEARAWWAYAYKFYRDQFSPWGGDDGGWSEGSAYWRGTIEHASFQDALLAIGDPLAYASAFWQNSPYFALYNVQPYRHTIFGDASNAGHFNLEPASADYLEHMARVQQDGYLRAYAALCADRRPRAADQGLGTLGRNYPTAAEFLVRNFIAADQPMPAPEPLSGLPPTRHFRDVGWVSLHSLLGRPEDDIHVTFKSSPYGSFSHSHADQNAFILNAYGESLAINSAYREFHNSPHHQQWTRQTKSKNALLIDGVGQKAQDKGATGKITRFESGDRFTWVTGDATVAYQLAQKKKDRVQRVTRDLVFIDSRYVVMRDRVVLKTPGKLSWLLHAEKSITAPENDRAVIEGARAALQVKLVAPGVTWRSTVTDEFPVPVDPKYAGGAGGATAGQWTKQAHLTAESTAAATEFTVYSVLWPYRTVLSSGAHMRIGFVEATLDGKTLTILRPDGKKDTLIVGDEALSLR